MDGISMEKEFPIEIDKKSKLLISEMNIKNKRG